MRAVFSAAVFAASVFFTRLASLEFQLSLRRPFFWQRVSYFLARRFFGLLCLVQL